MTVVHAGDGGRRAPARARRRRRRVARLAAVAARIVLPLLLFTGIFAAAIPSLGFLTGIRAIGGTRAGILMLFEPVVGVALAAWLLGEALAPIQIVGAAAILAAALLLQRAAAGPGGAGPTIVPGGAVGGSEHAAMPPRPAPIRVLLVDDHAMVRRGMRDFLELHDDLEIVGEAADGADGHRARPRSSGPTSSSWT